VLAQGSWGRWRRSAVLPALALALGLPAVARAQDPAKGAEEQPRPPTIFDFIDYEVRDPENLHPPARKFQDNWRRIWGALGMRYHLYPSQQTGPENWPPHLYAGGMNYSIWRNPVTGWPDF
jgi:hypothetical protein